MHQWMPSYLQDRSRRVVIGRASSEPRILTTGVPQGSVPGPLLFSLYVQPIGEVIQRHGLHFHHYADDLPVFSHFSLSHESLQDTLSRLEACITEIKHWMTQNYPKMNDQKIKFLPIVPRSAQHLLLGLSLTVGDASVATVSMVRNLGAHLTTHMEMTVNTSNIVKSYYFQLHHIARFNRYLPRKTKERVVNALVTSRLDYCKALMHGTTQDNLDKLQRVQNWAARLLVGTSKFENMKKVLMDLHWLPVRARISYKTCVLAHKAVHGEGPVYLRDLICLYMPGRSPRSGDSLQLARPRTRTKAGDAAFSVAAADLWNGLPTTIRRIHDEEFYSGSKDLFFKEELEHFDLRFSAF